MRLTDLLPGWAGPDAEITGLASDSRAVRPGFLFAALAGRRNDGAAYVADAVRNGAAAIVVPPGYVRTGAPALPETAIVIEAENPRHALSLIASRFYGPGPRTVAAVTGTNGKTSTADFTRQLWQAAGYDSASLGTLGIRRAAGNEPGAMTTPDPVVLHAALARLAAEGVTHLSMEASSHGLDQSRLDGVSISIAGFTNLTHDHLDYHGTMAVYRDAKLRLFSERVAEGGTAVLNADAPEFSLFRRAAEKRGVRVVAYGAQGAEIRLLERHPAPDGQFLRLSVFGREYETRLPLAGGFQAMNALCALGMALAAEADEEGAAPCHVEALAALRGVPGRLERVPGHPCGAVYVDYAHTPDALENILAALRPHTAGRLICLAGCGGDRDPAKRPVMGRILAEKADIGIVTDDNPRSEDPAVIRAAMLAGAGEAGHVSEIGGRRDAILHAVRLMRAGDVLVLAGKGHEQGQIIGSTIHPFDDRAEAENAIRSLLETKQTEKKQGV